MPLSQPVFPNSSNPYDASAGANLEIVKAFFDAMHSSVRFNMASDGGSVEPFEAATNLGTMSMGISYQHPRENFEGKDRLIVVAENTSANQVRHSFDFSVNEGETRNEATIRWLSEARSSLIASINALGLPFASAIPSVPGAEESTTVVNEEPDIEL
jgi:hypothetical protein